MYDATGMDSNEQQQAGPGFGAGGFGFNPFGEAFWSQFGGKGGKQGQQAGFEDLFKEFDEFFSMNQKQQTRGSSNADAAAGKAKGKDVNVGGAVFNRTA